MAKNRKILSLIIGGKNDDYMGDFRWRLGTCLNYLARSLAKIGRLEEVEVLVCDWGSEVPLQLQLSLTAEARQIVRFIIVPPETAQPAQKDSPFPIPIVQNVAIRRAEGEFLAQTDSDIIFTPFAIERILEILTGEVEIGVDTRKSLLTSSRRHIPYELTLAKPGISEIEDYLNQYGAMLPYDKLIPGVGTPSGMALMHRDIWNDCQGYDENLIYWGWMEIDLYLRITMRYLWRDLANFGFDLYHIEHYSGEDRLRQPRKANPMLTPHAFKANNENWGMADKNLTIIRAEEVETEEQFSGTEMKNSSDWRKEKMERLSSGEIISQISAAENEKILIQLLQRIGDTSVGKRLNLQDEIERRSKSLDKGASGGWDSKNALAWYLSNFHPLTYLDLSAGEGVSAAIAAAGCKAIAVYGWDRWSNEDEAPVMRGPTWLAEMFRDLGHAGYVRHLIGEDIPNLSELNCPRQFDLIFFNVFRQNDIERALGAIIQRLAEGGALIIRDPASKFLEASLTLLENYFPEDDLFVGRNCIFALNRKGIASAEEYGKEAKEVLTEAAKQNLGEGEFELDYIIPPEIKGDEFYAVISELAAEEEVRTILEIGSSSGEGSTEAFVQGMKNNPSLRQIYCMEVSRPRFKELQKRYHNNPKVKPYNLSTVTIDKFPTEDEVAEFYGKVRTGLNEYPLERVLGWLKQDIDYIEKTGAQTGGIAKIKEENGITLFDLVLIDGSEFTGRAELEEVYGAKYILLDDINGFKNRHNYDRLKADPDYELIRENWNLRAGYAVFKRREEALPVHFFTIVLNGEPFIRHHSEQFKDLPFKWHWHIIEGVAELRGDTGWSVVNGGKVTAELHRNGLSKDGTSEYLDQLAGEYKGNITVYRKPGGKFWEGKQEMVNAPLPNIAERCLLWQIDVDEFWSAEQIVKARDLFIANPQKTAAYYYCHYFVGKNLVTTTRDTYGNNSSYEWLRSWRFEPGMKWQSHEPPRLYRTASQGETIDVGAENPFSHSETEKAGLIFRHFAYVSEEQLRFKEIYYGYEEAVENWKKLQENTVFPAKLKDYFPWVKDDTLVDTVESQGIESLSIPQSPAKTNTNQKNIIVLSHERSGTHFLINTIAKNFPLYSNEEISISGDTEKLKEILSEYFGKFEPRIFKSHHQFYFFEPFFEELKKNFHIFYIVRDGRDVVTSCFHYYNSVPNEFPKTKSIGELLKQPADPGYSIVRSANLAERWVEHIDSWLKVRDDIHIIKYEELLSDTGAIVKRMGEILQIEPIPEMVKPTLHDRGVSPRKGIAGDWKNHFTEDDLRLFNSYASKTMEGLGYYAEDSESAGDKHIIWFRPDSIGDAVLAASMLAAIKTRYHGAKITAVCREPLEEFYRACPFVDEVVTLDWERLISDPAYKEEVARKLEQVDADILLNTVYSRETHTDEISLRSAAKEKIAHFGDLSNIDDIIREKHNRQYHRLIESKGDYKLEIERHKDFLRGWGIEIEDLTPAIWSSAADERFAEDFFRMQRLEPQKTIALFGGAQYDVRLYEGYGDALKEICRENDFAVVALGSDKEWEINQRNLQAVNGRIINLSGKTSLLQSAAILRRCRLAVGAETGLAHIACALNVPHVILLGGGHFGRFMPYSALTTIACLPLRCYECNWKCKYEHSHCVKDLAPSVLQHAIRAALEEKSDKIRIFYQSASSWRSGKGLPEWRDCKHLLKENNVEFHEVAVAEPESGKNPRSRTDFIRPQSFIQAGEEYYQKGESDKALYAFKEAIKIDPDCAEALNNLGVLYCSLNRIEDGIQNFRQALEIEPGNRDALLNYAEIMQSLERINEVQPAISKYLLIYPGDDEIRYLSDKVIPAVSINTGVEELKFSVITPSFNQGKYIEKCIESVLGQGYGNFEHIVIDGGSGDETVEILKRYPHLDWISEPDNGQSEALNKGLRKASGEIIAWVNSDDYYEPAIFRKVAGFFRDNPDKYVVMGNCNLVREDGEIFDIVVNRERGFKEMKQYWVGRSIPTQPAIFFRRELLDEFGYLDATLHLAMDYDLWMRFAQKHRFHHLDAVAANYLFHSRSKSGDNDWSRFEPEWNIVHRRYIEGLKPPPKVSVVIPCYNYAEYLPQAVDSVLRQTYEDFEIIIVNDGSSDDSAMVAKSIISKNRKARIRFYDKVHEGHPAHSRNQGIEIAFGEYIMCLDADDLIEPTLLSECARILDHNPEVGAVYPDQIHFEKDSERIIESQDWHPIVSLYNNPMPTCTMFRKKVWEEAGGYKPIGYEDWDLWITIGGDLGYQVQRIPKPLFRYRVNQGGVYAGHQEKDKENRARIILNHPKLYGEESVERAKEFLNRGKVSISH